MNLDLSIIVVNYNGKDLLKQCLSSVQAASSTVSLETIVIDNGSTDGSQEMLRSEFPQVRCVFNDRNQGFATANNQGIGIADGRFVLLLNSDTEIAGDSLTNLLGFAGGNPEAGIVGCRLTFADGTLQHSVRSFPSVWNLFCEATFLTELFPRSRLFGKYNRGDFDYDQPSEADWVSGAFFLIRRDVIEAIGLLDEQFFMYSEEMDYCLRASEKGLKVWYTPAATVVHHWLTVDTVSVRGIAWLLQSQILFFQKHYRGWKGHLLTLIRYFGLVLRLFVYPIVGILTINKRHFHHWNCLRIAFFKVLAAGRNYQPGRKADPWADLI